MSVMVMSVLLNVAVMWAIPSASTTFLARVAQITDACIRIDPGLRENHLRVSRADAEDVRESVQDFLVTWQVDACNPCHVVLSLPLLVFGTALADDADDPPPLDHLTMLADRFDAGPNLQTHAPEKKSN